MKLFKGLRQLLSFLKLWHLTYQLDAYLRVRGGLQFSLNFPAGSLPNLTVSHHLEGTVSSPKIPCRDGAHYPVQHTFTSSGGSTYKSFQGAPPQQDQILSFLHVFTEKCLCWRLAPPPMRVGTPQQEFPGSAPD